MQCMIKVKQQLCKEQLIVSEWVFSWCLISHKSAAWVWYEAPQTQSDTISCSTHSLAIWFSYFTTTFGWIYYKLCQNIWINFKTHCVLHLCFSWWLFPGFTMTSSTTSKSILICLMSSVFLWYFEADIVIVWHNTKSF